MILKIKIGIPPCLYHLIQGPVLSGSIAAGGLSFSEIGKARHFTTPLLSIN